MLEQLNVEYFDLAFEDLFGEQKTLNDRRSVIAKVIQFTGFDTSPLFIEPMKSLVDRRLSPEMKLNSANSYHLIPNIDEIEREFGSEESGFLFK